MTAALDFHRLGLSATRRTLTATFTAGASVAVMGPMASGKSQLLRIVAGLDRGVGGRVRVVGDVVSAGLSGVSSRATPQSLAKRAQQGAPAAAVAEALSATRLWDARHLALAGLTTGQRAACALLPCLVAPPEIVLIDGLLDLIDPWVRVDVLELLDRLVREGRLLLVATQHASVAEQLGRLILLRNREVVFAGTIEEFLRETGPTVLDVSTEDRAGVRALVDPLEVAVAETDRGLEIRVPEGQDLAVKLLLEGYGVVKLVTVRAPHLETALLARVDG